MDASKYQFSDDEIAKLNEYRDNQHNARLKVRFIALLMLANGVEIKTIASIVGKSIIVLQLWFLWHILCLYFDNFKFSYH